MSAQTDSARLDTVAPGDLIALPDDGREYKVVHTDAAGDAILLTVEGDSGETRDVELPADTVVRRTLEAKWESPQSPTAQSPRHDGHGQI